MSKVIDVEPLIKELDDMIEPVKDVLDDATIMAERTLVYYIKAKLESAPEHTGYWEFKRTTYCHSGCFCTACGKKSGIGGIRENQLKPFCPNCGARMKGEKPNGI